MYESKKTIDLSQKMVQILIDNGHEKEVQQLQNDVAKVFMRGLERAIKEHDLYQKFVDDAINLSQHSFNGNGIA